MATADQIVELLAKMAEERGRLLNQVAALEEDASAQRPEGKTGEAEWSAREQLSHLWEMERSYVAWVQRAIEEDGADVAGVRGTPVAVPVEQANTHTVAELTAALAAEREQTIALIRALTPDQFDRRATHPLFGSLTVLQWLRSFYRHDRMHTDQIAGRAPEYRPRFAGSVEPDQRRR